MIDEDIPDIEGSPDDHLSIKDECMIKHIRIKLEDILNELSEAKGSPIWDRLDATGWARCTSELTGATREDSRDKHIISNLAETNAYLTKRIIELECTNDKIVPETNQTTKRRWPTLNA